MKDYNHIKFTPREKLTISDTEYNERIKNTVFLSGKTNRIKINSKLYEYDENNKDIKPIYKDNELYIPFCISDKIFDLSKKELNADFSVDGVEYVSIKRACNLFGKSVDILNNSLFTIITDKGSEYDLDSKKELLIVNKASRDVIYDLPTNEKIIDDFNKNTSNNHPRLLYDKKTIENIRANKDKEPYKTWLKPIIKNADEYLVKIDKLYYHLHDGIRLLDMSRRTLRYVETLSFAYNITLDERYANRAIEILMTVTDDEIFPDWHPFHFLDTAEMCAAVSIGFDTLYDLLTDSQRAQIIKSIEKKALKEAYKDYHDLDRERTWKWSSSSSPAYPQNWVNVCFGGLSLGALAIGDEKMEDKSLVGDIIKEAMLRVNDLADTYSPDGVFRDGTNYWLFAMEYMFLGVCALRNVCKTDYGLTNAIGFEESFLWLSQMSGPCGMFNFENSELKETSSAEFLYLSDITENDAYINYRLNVLSRNSYEGKIRDIIWYKEPKDTGKISLPKTFASRNYGNMALRTGFSKNDTYMAAFTKNPDCDSRTHQEHDGTFILDIDGVRWFVDLGSDRGAYVGHLHRVYYYRYRAEGHNTIIIEPTYEHNHDPFEGGKLIDISETEKSLYGIYDLTKKLEYKGCTKWHRGYKIDKETKNALIQDEFSAKEGVSFYSFYHTDGEIEVMPDGKNAKIHKDGKTLNVKLVSDNKDAKFVKMEANPLSTSPQRSDEAECINTDFTKLCIHLEDVKDVKISVECFIEGNTTSFDEYIDLEKWN